MNYERYAEAGKRLNAVSCRHLRSTDISERQAR